MNKVYLHSCYLVFSGYGGEWVLPAVLQVMAYECN